MQATPAKKSTTTTKRTRKATAAGAGSPTHDEIAARAYELYEKSGFRGGRDVEFWVEAERQLREELIKA
jgi:hypothetical protein